MQTERFVSYAKMSDSTEETLISIPSYILKMIEMYSSGSVEIFVIDENHLGIRKYNQSCNKGSLPKEYEEIIKDISELEEIVKRLRTKINILEPVNVDNLKEENGLVEPVTNS